MRGLAALDLRLLRLLRTPGHSPPVEAATINLARSGENGLLWYVIALAGAALDRRGDRDAYFRAVKIVLATLVANTIVKQTVRRARPVFEEELPALTPVLSGRSYPSAHSSTSFAGARALSAAGLPAAPSTRWPSRWPCRARTSGCTTPRTSWRGRLSVTAWHAS